jgi:late competence protein required for DNA uptake (superfamily II DNA/RNA helicase)
LSNYRSGPGKNEKVPSPKEILEKYQHRLTEAEVAFLKSLSEWKGKLTPNQAAAAKDIFENVQERYGPRLVR